MDKGLSAMGTPRHAGRIGGFTLIEAMISLFFLSFIVSEVAVVSIYSTRSANYARLLTEADTLGNLILEQTRNTAYKSLNYAFVNSTTPPVFDFRIKYDIDKDGIPDAFTETCTPAPSSTSTVAVCTLTAGRFTVTRTVTPLPSGAFDLSTLAAITVKVSWPKATESFLDDSDPTGKTQSITISTMRAKF